MRVLITGGAGYVGSVLVHRLLQEPDIELVKVYDTFNFGSEALLGSMCKRLELVNGDILDILSLGEAVKDVDVVFHLAAIVGYPACARDPNVARQVNVLGTRNVVNALRSDQRIIYASTGSVYGQLGDGMCTEDILPKPISVYGQTKLEAEEPVLNHGGVVYRFATIFGVSPCMRFDLLVNDFTRRAVQDKFLVIYEASARRTFMHVREAAESYVLALRRYAMLSGQVFNVGFEQYNFTKRAVAEVISSIFPIYIHEASVGKDMDARDYAVGYGKIRSFGFTTPQVSLAEGIREIGQFCQSMSRHGYWR